MPKCFLKMIKGYIRINLIGLLCLFLVSCSKYQKLRKSTEWQLKYEAAMKYYEKKDFARAVALFEDILPIIRGTKEAESANFYYAYAHFYQDLFILSAHYFETFLEIYSRVIWQLKPIICLDIPSTCSLPNLIWINHLVIKP